MIDYEVCIPKNTTIRFHVRKKIGTQISRTIKHETQRLLQKEKSERVKKLFQIVCTQVHNKLL